MNIGEAERRCGLPAKTIRYYEEIGLVVPERRDNGYRDYDEPGVRKLQFLQRARSLGFSVQDCRALLSLYDDRKRASADVKAIAEAHLERIERKIDELDSLRRALQHLVTACHGDERPDCPIIDELAGEER
ncbi:MAG: Cu(I)-responsive transcriptional regulator [Kiloniellales bacterium]|nr:Cu(I)-responsive transcriptional regulator [Kiloniellales bacterium]